MPGDYHENPQSEYPLSRPSFEASTFSIKVENIISYAKPLSQCSDIDRTEFSVKGEFGMLWSYSAH
jgi:hypothetical protein